MSEPTRAQMLDTLIGNVENWPDSQLRQYARAMIESYVPSRLVKVVQTELRWALSQVDNEHIKLAYDKLHENEDTLQADIDRLKSAYTSLGVRGAI